LCCVTQDKELEDISVVREFSNVFSEETPRLPPKGEIDFEIEFDLGARPISKPPYRMIPVTETAIGTLVTKGLYKTKRILMVSASTICKEKGWNCEIVYRS